MRMYNINYSCILSNNFHLISQFLILVFAQADKIDAQIKNVDPGKWNDVVKVGKTYMIQNFEFEKNIGQFRPTKHAFKLNFVYSTKVKEHDFPMIP